jgi:hypothetical protein
MSVQFQNTHLNLKKYSLYETHNIESIITGTAKNYQNLTIATCMFFIRVMMNVIMRLCVENKDETKNSLQLKSKYTHT